MTRNTTFQPETEPFRYHRALQLNERTIQGPIPFLNPTHAHYDPSHGEDTHAVSGYSQAQQDRPTQDADAPSFGLKWTSRNSRKGRHALIYDEPKCGTAAASSPVPTNTLTETLRGVRRMFSYFPYWFVPMRDAAHHERLTAFQGHLIPSRHNFHLRLPDLVPQCSVLLSAIHEPRLEVSW